MTLRTLRPLALCAAGLLAAPAALAQPCTSGATFGDLSITSTRGTGQGSFQQIGARFIAPCDGLLSTLTLPLGGTVTVEAVAFNIGASNTIPSEISVSDQQGVSGAPSSGGELVTFTFGVPLEVTGGEEVGFLLQTVSGNGTAPGTFNDELANTSRIFTTSSVSPGNTFNNEAADQPFLATFTMGGEPPLVTGSLAYGTCPEALPLGRSSCRVDASGTFNGDSGQRYTVFLRIVENGRVAFRGEVKPRAGQTVEQSIKFTALADDPGSFTLELVAVEGSVASPAGGTVLGTLAFTKGTPLLRAAEGLTVFPNPATEQATLRFAVAEASEAVLVIYDALGREVARPVEGNVSGTVEATFDASGLPAGLYVARLTTAAGTETVRLSVVR